ncbi:MAG: methyltransferase domain-containing protein [Candidatus Omnitrophota bacterium]|nr:methyltransferase domain-containing protein [Candidatus Omnitrophota bacterium]
MEIKIEKIIYPGKSLGFSENKTILTNEGIPGEIVEVIPLEEKKNYIEAKTVKIITPSSARVTPACSHYQACSPYQYIDYKTQLAIKESQLREIFPDANIIITPSPEIWGYRNNIRLNIIWKDNLAFLAYHTPETRDMFMHIDSCNLVSENVNNLLASFIKLVNKENLNFIKEIKVRESRGRSRPSPTKDLMLTVYPPACRDGFETRPYIEEIVSEKTFRIGPDSFFQINIPMLEAALKEIKKHLNPEKKETIADLYCGIGTFGIAFSQYVKEIIGIESSPDNISFLKSNLKLNNINNFKLYEGDCEKLFPSLMTKSIDMLMLDPPRKGLDNMLCQHILLSSIKKIIYLSCNPTTLSRDLKILGQRYAIKTLHMFDFFPHTPHIETLAILEKKQL